MGRYHDNTSEERQFFNLFHSHRRKKKKQIEVTVFLCYPKTSKSWERDRPFGSPHLIVFAIYLQSNCLFNDLPLFALTILPGKLFHTFMILCMGKKKKRNTSWHLFWICFSLIFIYTLLFYHLCWAQNRKPCWHFPNHLNFMLFN